MKILVTMLVAVAGFVGGFALALLASFLLFRPPVNCPSPCDDGAIVAMGFIFLFGPMFGCIAGSWALRILSRWRKKQSHVSA